MIQAAFIDIGNVLIFFDYQKMFRQVGEVWGRSVEDVEKFLIDQKIGEEYELGMDMTTSRLLDLFAERALKPYQSEELLLAISDIFTPNSAIYPLIHQMKEEGIALFLLSNTCPAHFDFLSEHFPILQEFDGKVLSYQVHARKPSEAIFKKALEMAGTSPANCFYVDDVPEYVTAARRLGINAEVYQNVPLLYENLLQRGIIRE